MTDDIRTYAMVYDGVHDNTRIVDVTGKDLSENVRTVTVTPAMIKAGATTLEDGMVGDISSLHAEHIVRRIFIAMALEAKK